MSAIYTLRTNLKIEILEDKDQTAAHPIVFDHLHYALPDPPEAQAWYAKCSVLNQWRTPATK